MCKLINQIVITIEIILILSTHFNAINSQLTDSSSKLLYSEQEIIDSLVRTWSPLVWLAPNEKYMPGDVKLFLSNVHAEREKPSNKKIQDISDDLSKYSYYYDYDAYKDLIYYDGNGATGSGTSSSGNRNKRNFDRETSLEHIFELPIENSSEDWFLVTNEDLDTLIKNKSSFIYGTNPTVGNVPIYSVVSSCTTKPVGDSVSNNEIVKVTPVMPPKKIPYIPLSKTPEIDDYEPPSADVTDTAIKKLPIETENSASNEIVDEKPMKFSEPIVHHMGRRSVENLTTVSSDEIPNVLRTVNITGNISNNNMETGGWNPISNSIDVDENFKNETDTESDDVNNLLPHFHVTYWMFYPYSQGKTICTLNIPVLGPVPIPLIPIFNICLGTRKEFGSHVGDWEHMSLFFRGKMHPDEMYVSAHDAGAFYKYDRLTGTFEYQRQETRKGILQQPTFPKVVVTSDTHPVLFSAEGSHGLWSAPGKHRFVRVPRLYDINGFGQPWFTWKNVEIIYNDTFRGKRSLNPSWMKYRGKWGNPKSQCHPLRKFGLYFCEKSDGPTGIPRKTPHFTCDQEPISG
jgi:hypothetical protein